MYRCSSVSDCTGGACPAHTRGLPCFRKFNRGRHVKLYGFLVAVASVRGWHVNLILPRLVQLFEIYLPMRTPAAVRSSRVPRLSRLMRGTNPGEVLNLGTAVNLSQVLPTAVVRVKI